MNLPTMVYKNVVRVEAVVLRRGYGLSRRGRSDYLLGRIG